MDRTADRTFDTDGEALCCAAAVRLGGALRVLAALGGLSDRYGRIEAGLGSLKAFVGGRERDDDALAEAFVANWSLGTRYGDELPGAAFFRAGTRIVDVAIIVARTEQPVDPVQGLSQALEAAAAWPSEIHISSFTQLADFERACQTEAEERLRTGGLPGLWELADEQAGHYRRAAELLVG
ncbi:hypothetical protein U5640_29950 [Streptomyces sp. SS7]|uniref:hypothetical protein n=1 Tax=Streptomyces sp. SS7 TaxID=3108485 RepID=UPI0030EE0FF6